MTGSQPDNAASGQSTHNEKLRALLAPDFETGGNRREIILIPLAAVFMALVIGAVIMMATSVAPATILRSFVAMAEPAARKPFSVAARERSTRGGVEVVVATICRVWWARPPRRRRRPPRFCSNEIVRDPCCFFRCLRSQPCTERAACADGTLPVKRLEKRES